MEKSKMSILDCTSDLHVFCNGDFCECECHKDSRIKLAYAINNTPVLYLSNAEIVEYNWVIGYVVLERPKYSYRKETFFIENLMIVNLDA